LQKESETKKRWFYVALKKLYWSLVAKMVSLLAEMINFNMIQKNDMVDVNVNVDVNTSFTALANPCTWTKQLSFYPIQCPLRRYLPSPFYAPCIDSHPEILLHATAGLAIDCNPEATKMGRVNRLLWRGITVIRMNMGSLIFESCI